MSKITLDRKNSESAITALDEGLKSLNFTDNFKGFAWSGAVAAGADALIRNGLRDGTIPTGFIVTMAEGANNVIKGSREWNKDYVSITNAGAVNATLSVFFFR